MAETAKKQKLLHFLEGENIEIPDVTPDDLQRFAAGLHDIGIHPRSQARILSGIKSFFHFLVIADYQEADPSEAGLRAGKGAEGVRAETVDDAPGVQPHRRRAERGFVQEIALAPLLNLHAGVERPFAREHNAARLHAKRRFRPFHAGELALLPGEQRFLLVLAVLSGRDELHGIGGTMLLNPWFVQISFLAIAT